MEAVKKCSMFFIEGKCCPIPQYCKITMSWDLNSSKQTRKLGYSFNTLDADYYKQVCSKIMEKACGKFLST